MKGNNAEVWMDAKRQQGEGRKCQVSDIEWAFEWI